MEQIQERHVEDDELAEDRLWPHDPDGASWAPTETVATKKRGRRKIPEMWTRVISIVHDDPTDVDVFEIEKDKETLDQRLPYPR